MKSRESDRNKTFARSVILILLATVFSMALVVNPALPARAFTVPNFVSNNLGASPYGFSITIANAGDLIAVELQIENNAVSLPTATISDSLGDIFNVATSAVISFDSLTPPQCDNHGCAGTWIFYATAKTTGSDTITITYANGIGGSVQAQDVVGITPAVQSSNLGYFSSATTTNLSGRSYLAIAGSATFAVMSIFTTCTASYTFTPGSGFTFSSASIYGGAMYGSPTTGPSGTSTDFPATCSTAVGNFLSVEAVFGAFFTCSITNMTAGNYVVANIGKVYDFFCRIQSDAIDATNAAITDVKIKFNDSVNQYVFEYDNATGIASVDEGGSFSTLGTPLVSQSYNPTTTIRSMNITFPIILNAGAVDSENRSLSLYAATTTGTRGFSYVQTDYFNIYDNGGTMNYLLKGDCSIPSGADTFQTICQYGSGSHNWISENATYYDLQNYAAQFQIEMRNASTGLDEPAIWQNYANSGSGTNPSSNKGDWKINAGFYYWDNSSSTCCWVKGINLVLEMNVGRVGSTNLWTQFDAVWYDGTNQVANQTFNAFVPTDNGGSPVNLWLNFWYSQNNASTFEGGEVGAYYTGMHETNYLVWSSWSPFQGNQTQSQVFMPLVNHSDDLMSATQTSMTKVFMNMTRPGAPNQHTNQGDFSIETDGFVQQTFNVATAGASIGIATPTFAVAVVPVLQSNSIFSPIINALKSLASLITVALTGVGTAIWNGLGSRFPWFTASLSFMSSFIVNLVDFIATLFVWIIDALKFTYGIISIVFYPINAIIGAWDYLIITYGGIFKGANLTAMIEIVVLYVFVGWVLDNAERGNGGAFLNAATMGWRIADSMAWWVWAIAKFFIDAIEGLIP